VRADELKAFAILAEFGDEEREALAELLEECQLPDGKSIFREGAEADGLVLIAEGRLKLKSKRSGSVVAILEAPQHLGGASLFSVGRREVSALAKGPTTVWLLSRTGLARLAEDAPRAAFRLAEAVAGELAGMMRMGLEVLVDNELD
jgi:CRP-like cAMP-binding protein